MQSPSIISYSDGKTVQNPVVQIWDDLHNEQSGFYRAFWCSSPTAETGSPVIGYCSPGGSHKTIRATAAEVWKLFPDALIYRNGKPI